MSNKKFLASIVLVLAVVFAQVGTALAAPQAQEGTTTTITGTITDIHTEVNESGETIVVVTLEGYQPISLSAQEAADNLLFDLATQTLLVQAGATVVLVVDSEDVVPVEEEIVHPIAALLAGFFGEDAGVVNGYHEDGFGFGVIAQALWMSNNLGGDTAAAGLILEAKKSGDFSAFLLEDGTSPANWGQFKKAILEKKNNLGVIVSGHADPLTGEEVQEQPGNGHGNGRNNGNGKGNGHNK